MCIYIYMYRDLYSLMFWQTLGQYKTSLGFYCMYIYKNFVTFNVSRGMVNIHIYRLSSCRRTKLHR